MRPSFILKVAVCILAAAVMTTAMGTGDTYAKKPKKEQVAGRDPSRTPNTLRVLYWNIQCGMLADEENNFDKFVEWVKKYDPDVCMWIEASSVFESFKSDKRIKKGTGYLPEGWWELAPRYGHEYVGISSWIAYPQIVTSKYPIETILKIWNTDDPKTPLSHGVGLHSIKVRDDLEIYFLTVHLHPYGYAPGVPKEQRSQSSKEGGGHYTRLKQLQYICGQTVLNPKYASQQNWVMAGDFNSRTDTDNWYYDKDINSKTYMAHKWLHENTTLIDVLAKRFPTQFGATHRQKQRIDYVQVSPSMYDRVVKAMVIHDEWTYDAFIDRTGVSNFSYPSDHHPILVDFKLD